MFGRSPTSRKSTRRGSVAIQIGILMVVLIGMAALGTEIPFLMYMHRKMQTAADSAALGAAVALTKGYPSPISTEAYGVAAALGFTNGASNVTITVNNPPTSGNYTTNSSAVEVIVTKPQTLKLAGLLGVSVYNLSARAVALSGAGSGGYCMLSLDTGLGWGIGLWGGITVTMNDCGMAANAYGPAAIDVGSGATLTAPFVSTVGQLLSIWSTVNVPSILQNQQAIADPYADVATPSSTGCDHDYFTIGYTATTTTLQPGRYCHGLGITNGANVIFAPGVYYIKGGNLVVAGTPMNVVGDGVTFVLTTIDGCAICYAGIQITNGSVLTLSAPTSGPTAGILFFADRNAPTGTASLFSAFGSMDLTGAIYLPTHLLTYAGGGTITGCNQVIAWDINDYLLNMTFDGSCISGTAMRKIGGSTVLVE